MNRYRGAVRAKLRALRRQLQELQGLVSTASVSMDTVVTERQTIDANAQAIADIRLGHRTDIREWRASVAKMLAEVRSIANEPGLIEQVPKALAGDDQDDRRKLEAVVARVTARAASSASTPGA